MGAASGQNDDNFFSAKRTVPYSFPGTKGSPLNIPYSVANSRWAYTHMFWNTYTSTCNAKDNFLSKQILLQDRTSFK